MARLAPLFAVGVILVGLGAILWEVYRQSRLPIRPVPPDGRWPTWVDDHEPDSHA